MTKLSNVRQFNIGRIQPYNGVTGTWLLALGLLLLVKPDRLRAVETTTVSETIEWSIDGLSDGAIKFHTREDQPSGSRVLYFAPIKIGEDLVVHVKTHPRQEDNDKRQINIIIPQEGVFYSTQLEWYRFAGPSHTWDLPPPPVMEVALKNRYSPFKQIPEIDPRYQGDKWIHIQYAEFSIQSGMVIHHIFVIPTSLHQLMPDGSRKGLPEYDREDVTTHKKTPHGCNGCTPIGLPGFHVNTATLQPVIQDTLYAHGGLGPEFILRLTYNPDPNDATAFGRGWRLNYDSLARPTLRGAEVVRGDGLLLRFALPLTALLDQVTTNGNATTISLDPTAGGISGAGTNWDGYYARDANGRRLRYQEPDETAGEALILETRGSMLRHVYTPTDNSPETFLLTRIEDRNGNALLVRRNTSGRINQIEDAGGRTIDFTYDELSGVCRRITVPGGKTIEFDYDTSGHLTQVTDLLGNQSSYDYNAEGYISRMTSEGRTWTFAWQGETGRYLKEVRDPAGNVTQYDLAVQDWEFRRMRVTDPSGRAFIYEYPKDRYAGSEQPGDTQIQYDTAGRPVSIKARNGSIRTIQYGTNGLIAQVADFNGGVSRWTHNELGLPLTFVDALGSETGYTYDERGNLVESRSPGGRVRKFEYNDLGQLISETRDGQAATTFGYNTFGNLTLVRDPQGFETRYTYDANGVNLVAVQNARGYTRHYEYDANQRLTRIIYPDGTSEERVYDCCAQTAVRNRNGDWRLVTRSPDLSVLTETDYEGNSITNHYDPAGRLIRREDAAGNFLSYTYNDKGQPATISNPLGDEATLLYNQNDELLHVSFSKERWGPNQTEEAGVWWLAYDAMGHLSTVNGKYIVRDPLYRPLRTQNRRGSTFGLVRDAEGWVTATTLNNRTNATFTYNQAGFLTSHQHALGSEVYHHDQRGFITNTLYANQRAVSRRFDGVGNIAEIVYPDGTVARYAYDTLDRVTNVVWGDAAILFSYDAEGNRLRETRSNECDSQYAYDRNGMITNLSHSGSAGLLLALECERDVRGLTTSRRKTGGVLPWQPLLRAATVTAAYNPESALVSWNGDSCASDADANQKSLSDERGFTAAYTANNLMESWTVYAITNQALYDGLDRLIEWRQGDNVRRFFYDEQDRLLFECDAQGRLTAEYLYVGRQPVAMRVRQGVAFFHLDLSANVVLMTDQQGKVAALYQYLPYGLAAGSYSRVPNLFTFVGGQGVINLDNGLYLMRYRVYDALSRAFLTPDPLGYGVDFNARRYAMSCPLDMTDPFGLSAGIAGGTPQLDYRVSNLGDNCVVVTADKTVGLSQWGPFASIGKIGYALWEKDWDTAAGETGMALVGLWSATAGLALDFILTPSNANAYAQHETEEDRIRACIEHMEKTGINYGFKEPPSVPDYSSDRHLEYISETYGTEDE